MMQLSHPYQIDGLGGTATTDEDAHIRDLIEQVLFTTPGERVNRPAFGCGLLRMLFAPVDDALAVATQAMLQSSLQRWVGDLVRIDEVRVEQSDSTVGVTVRYVILRSRQAQVAQFSREI